MKTIACISTVFACAVIGSTAHATTYYADASRPDDSGAGIDWSTAKKTIQAAVDLAVSNDTVLVTNGVYDTGGGTTPGYSCSNRVIIVASITVRSANGPADTIILGAPDPITSGTGSNAVRCVYMSVGTLAGFMLTNGYTMTGGDHKHDQSGGGVNLYGGNGVVSNCTISGNSAHCGGGVAYGTVNNCTISGNSASYEGGGTDGSTVSNCTISGNSAPYGGGTCYGTVNNCTINDNYAEGYGGGTYGWTNEGTVNNCTISGNRADNGGGGTAWGTVNNCTIISNSAKLFGGGGTYYGTVNNCTISGNGSTDVGGGTSYSTVNNCTISGNNAYWGGGTYFGTVNTCTIISNSALLIGGGTCGGTANNCLIGGNSAVLGGGTSGGRTRLYATGIVNNCTIIGNTATSLGGGALRGTLNNCTVAANSTTNCGGGTYESTVRNTIVWDNQAAISDNYCSGILEFSCTIPPADGLGNITNDPSFANAVSGDYRLSSGSYCVNAGSNNYAPMPLDLDGNPRILYGCVDMGAYEFANGTLWCDFTAAPVDTLVDAPVQFTSTIGGSNTAIAYYWWDFQYDGTFDTNGAGLYAVEWHYATDGTNSVQLVVSNAIGQVATQTRLKYITVVPEPTAIGYGLAVIMMLMMRHQSRSA